MKETNITYEQQLKEISQPCMLRLKEEEDLQPSFSFCAFYGWATWKKEREEKRRRRDVSHLLLRPPQAIGPQIC